MAHTHPVVDSDSRFVINSTTREISTTSDKLELIQGDHRSERITFEIPKIVEGHDMSLSDRIEVHYINIDRRTNATSRDVYIIDDAAVDGDKLTFSWLISGNATKYYGRLNFIILFECLDPDGNYTYKWNTEICKLLTIGEGISNTSAVIEDHSDILEKFKKEILEYVDSKQDMLIQSGASVGQIAKITAVDSSGKPTAWEAVDMPSGGGSTVELDTTLTESGKAADAKAVGDALAEKQDSGNYVKSVNGTAPDAIGNVTVETGSPTDEQVASSVEAWLDAHPEATTTVADGSINPDKTTWMRRVWHNIFDVSTITDGRYFYSGSNDDTTGGGTADYFVSDYIPVIAGREYVFSHKSMALRWTDANKTFISGSASTVSVAGQKVTTPDGAAFVRFSLKKGGLTPEEVQAQVYEYIGEVWEYDTYKNLYSIVMTDARYSKAIADMVEEKFVDGSLAPADLFADESILYKQMKGWDEFHWNLVDADKLEEGTIDAATGADAFTPNSFIHRRTPYMPVTPGETLFWMWSNVYGYDANKNFVSEITQTSGIGVVTDGVYFIRATTYGNNVEPTINIYRRGYGQNELKYDSEYPYSHGFPVFKDEDSKEGFECYLGIHPWADKNFSIIGDSFTAPGVWASVMCANLKAANRWNHAISGARFGDAEGVPMTAYEQAQEMVTDGNTPDVILITMGTNDANNSITIGNIVQSNSISDFDLTTYTGGMQACLNYLQNNFPNAIIYVGWTPMGGLVNGTKAEYITRMQEVCLMYGVEYIETRTCGVTRFSDAYAECYENGTNGGHPTGVGQQKIGAYMTRLMQSKM